MIPEKGTKRQIKEFVLRLFQHRVVCNSCRVLRGIEEFQNPRLLELQVGSLGLCDICGEHRGGIDMLCAFNR